MALVYRHRRSTDLAVFYIGISSNTKRPYSKLRSKAWKNTVEKHGYIVEIIINDISRKEAQELEIFLIQEYGRRDLGKGILVNHTDGGELYQGRVVTKETRKKISEAAKKRTNSQKEESKIKRAERRKNWPEEKEKAYREKISRLHKGRKNSKEVRLKMSESAKKESYH